MLQREKFAKGIFECKPAVQAELVVLEPFEYDVQEDNAFYIKDMTRCDRMDKSTRARKRRRMLREIRQNRHNLGYSDNSLMS